MIDAEAAYAALFTLIWPADAETFKNDRATARILRHWNDVAPEECPALFQAQGDWHPQETAANGLPTRWFIDATLYVYARRQANLSPSAVINPLLTELVSKFQPHPVRGEQSLGGLAQWARIFGTIETSEGTLGDLEVALIPVRVLLV